MPCETDNEREHYSILTTLRYRFCRGRRTAVKGAAPLLPKGLRRKAPCLANVPRWRGFDVGSFLFLGPQQRRLGGGRAEEKAVGAKRAEGKERVAGKRIERQGRRCLLCPSAPLPTPAPALEFSAVHKSSQHLAHSGTANWASGHATSKQPTPTRQAVPLTPRPMPINHVLFGASIHLSSSAPKKDPQTAIARPRLFVFLLGFRPCPGPQHPTHQAFLRLSTPTGLAFKFQSASPPV